jgi:hypothetical protein
MRSVLLRIARVFFLGFALIACAAPASALTQGEAHVWEMQEIVLEAQRDYANPYTDVSCWIDLAGPGFAQRVYGFWDGGRRFRIRFVATQPGEWHWRTGSNQPGDAGLNGGGGNLRAVAWTDAEKTANANRRGFIRAAANGHALQYADGTPFFLTGDTWLAASTWRLPWRGGAEPPAGFVPGPQLGFEDAVIFRKRQGFNSVSLIAAFPNWAADQYGATYADVRGVYLRNAWEKFGVWAPNAKVSTADGATTTAKNMEDEAGNRPFAIVPDHEGLADFDRLDPAYFQSLDRKLRFLAEQGFVPVFEPVRRDSGPAWKAYFDFDASYARFVAYLAARYGAYNMIFSGVHLDWIPKEFSLTADEYNKALTIWRQRYGGLPFGQPVTVLIDSSTYQRFGHGAAVPWLTMHSVGNKPRNNGIAAMIEEEFRLSPPYPTANLEPYYAGWSHDMNRPSGETPAPDSPRDIYFARAMMYGSVLSGALAGHVYGTGAYDITVAGEPSGWRPYFWQTLGYKSGGEMQYLRKFVLSEGARYRDLAPANGGLAPRTAPEAPADGLDGWSFLMRTADRGFALFYSEAGAAKPKLKGFAPNARYRWTWFDPRHGEWRRAVILAADAAGTLTAPRIPAAANRTAPDWAAKIVRLP